MGDLSLSNIAAPQVPGGRSLASVGQAQPADMLGYAIRQNLFPGEDSYFKSNPHVAGMAAETGDVILNPYSPAGVNREAVARNEAFRLHLKNRNAAPDFAVTDEQRSAFKGTAYENNDHDLRSTLAARIYSNDPSARSTPEQQQWVQRFLSESQGR
jgi:hypothetical protein